MERMDSGYRDFAECKENIDELPSVYLKKLYYDTVTFSPHNLNMLRDIVGSDQMAMGSDYPHLLGSIEKSADAHATGEEVLDGRAVLVSDAGPQEADHVLAA